MKKAFDIVYERLLELKLDENILCSEFWKRIINLQVNFDEEKAWELVIENIEWLINSDVTTTSDLKKWFTEKKLNDHNIYTKGHVSATNERIIGLGTVKIIAMGHSKVSLFDKSHCDGYDSTFIKGFQNSSFAVTECMGEAFHNCKCVAKYQSKVEAWDNAVVKAEDYSFVIKHDKAIVEASSRAHSIVQ